MVIAGLLLCILNINLYSKNIGLIGVNAHYSFISSYYSIESAALEKKSHTSYSDGLGVGGFFDYKYSPYTGIKLFFSFFPSWKTDDSLLNYNVKDIMFEIGFLTKILFRSKPYNFWVGYGPAMQYVLSESLDNYIVSFYFASGCNYDYSEKWCIIPEICLGANMHLKNKKYQEMVQNIIETTDFFNNGFTISIKLGLGYKYN